VVTNVMTDRLPIVANRAVATGGEYKTTYHLEFPGKGKSGFIGVTSVRLKIINYSNELVNVMYSMPARVDGKRVLFWNEDKRVGPRDVFVRSVELLESIKLIDLSVMKEGVSQDEKVNLLKLVEIQVETMGQKTNEQVGIEIQVEESFYNTNVRPFRFFKELALDGEHMGEIDGAEKIKGRNPIQLGSLPDEGYHSVGLYPCETNARLLLLYWYEGGKPMAPVRIRSKEDGDVRIVIPGLSMVENNYKSGWDYYRASFGNLQFGFMDQVDAWGTITPEGTPFEVMIKEFNKRLTILDHMTPVIYYDRRSITLMARAQLVEVVGRPAFGGAY